VFERYGNAWPPPQGAFELDHLIPLVLGGDNSEANLWPQPAGPGPSFRDKDALEVRLAWLVCVKGLPLVEAQHRIATDWIAAWTALRDIPRGKTP